MIWIQIAVFIPQIAVKAIAGSAMIYFLLSVGAVPNDFGV